MPAQSTVHRMMSYTAWADDVMLNNAARLPAFDLLAPRDALFNSIAGTFDHILVVAEIFQAHLQARRHPHTARYRGEILGFSEVAMNDYYVACARDWTDAELAETIDFDFVGGGKRAMSREDILLHLANHATYHRGFVSTLLYPFVKGGAATDLTVFIRDVWSRNAAQL